MQISEKLGLGTVQFGLPYGISNKGGQTPAEEVSKILSYASNNQIEVLDSASGYGSAEKVLGKNNLSSFKVISKFLPPSENQKVVDQFQKSLRDLGVSSLYAYLAHRPLDLISHPQHWQELNELKAERKIKKIGFSLNEPQELDQLSLQGFHPDIIQVPYNYFDRRFEAASKKLKEKGCEIHTRSSFLQGLFFMNPEGLSNYFDEVKPILKQLQNLENINGALLNFVIQKPFIDKVIIGIENRKQLKDNVLKAENAYSLPFLEEKISDNILIPSRWPK